MSRRQSGTDLFNFCWSAFLDCWCHYIRTCTCNIHSIQQSYSVGLYTLDPRGLNVGAILMCVASYIHIMYSLL